MNYNAPSLKINHTITIKLSQLKDRPAAANTTGQYYPHFYSLIYLHECIERLKGQVFIVLCRIIKSFPLSGSLKLQNINIKDPEGICDSTGESSDNFMKCVHTSFSFCTFLGKR